ncbi:MAG: bifunctional alpha,alpha-trehalose-phosphate synthase (UDP-forming)/trehalose-phosphatase [Chitinophagaceae bacterium]|nr:MAG: bifunctional alpha,alpha-trehalose-phosphate synthase (UDP-forming)/trehalose-phosphatase [Chitinophagaceae bacterium]
MQEQRLFIVANRLPVQVREEGENAVISPVSGGLVSAVKSYLQQGSARFPEVYWAGVPGCSMDTWRRATRQMESSAFRYLPVPVADDLYERYYNGFSNSVLWPLFHYFPSYAEYDEQDFEAYKAVNRKFAETLARACRPGDTIWIHDYHLIPLAHLLRSLVPGVTIGFFLHVPFPSYELFRLLPRHWQHELLEGILHADLAGFHTMDYAGHFLHSVQMVLGVGHDKHILRFRGRLVKVDVFPISIDYDQFHEASLSAGVGALRARLREQWSGYKIIFSVDRLDYTKGLQNRLLAYEQFLRSNPAYRGKVVFILVVVPSRDGIAKYAERKRLIDERTARINSELGDLHWRPLVYHYNHLSFEEMLALYSLCDVALITPLRDGMNLVAKEFVASRADKQGVLVLSEMAGAARELTDALLINPNDARELSAKIREALEMPPAEQELRMTRMQQRISYYHVRAWAEDFMAGLDGIKQKQLHFQEIFLDLHARQGLLDDYRVAKRCLLLLDYDGTLVPFSRSPEGAVPDPELRLLLRNLAQAEGNDLYLISGRDSAWLEKHFGDLPLRLIAEHGARVRQPDGQWYSEVQTHSEWKSAVHQIMDMYVRRCAHAFVEEKEFSVVWHYRNAQPELGCLRAAELTQELKEFIGSQRLEVIPGDKIIEVRNCGIDKGTAIRKVIADSTYDFVFAVGDDRTDEDMFKTLIGRPNCYTIKVGPNASFAQFNLMQPGMVRTLLQQMKRARSFPLPV